MTDDSCITLTLENPGDSDQFGIDLAMSVEKGGSIYLKGDLGSGKSTIARAFIRQLCGNHELEVPSPTFSLVQSYEPPAERSIDEILHADLYRISDPGELNELGLPNTDPSSLAIVEWPENAKGELPEPDLLISISDTKTGNGREVQITGNGKWRELLERSLAIRRFLNEGWGSSVARNHLAGDASSRAYETVMLGNDSRILMNAPPKPDGPVIRDGKPYSQIAHLAENVSAFVGVAKILENAGLRTPAIYHQSLDEGLLLLENLGAEQIIDGQGKPIRNRYIASGETLARFHRTDISRETMLLDNSRYRICDYDREAMMIEAELLVDWYAPRFKGGKLSKTERTDFIAIWNALITVLEGSEKRVVLRDYHSPNIIWRESEVDTGKVAVIDFQDAVYGPSAYDLASLGQDARIDVSSELEDAVKARYREMRAGAGNFDPERFNSDYAIMAAQRATKILGIFVRLDERDSKPDYLRHLPRIQSYLARNLVHPVLAEYRTWCKNVIGL